MLEPQTSFLIYTVGLVIEILGAWSAYTAIPKCENDDEYDEEELYKRIRRGFFNMGLFLTIGLLMQYIAGL